MFFCLCEEINNKNNVKLLYNNELLLIVSIVVGWFYDVF